MNHRDVYKLLVPGALVHVDGKEVRVFKMSGYRHVHVEVVATGHSFHVKTGEIDETFGVFMPNPMAYDPAAEERADEARRYPKGSLDDESRILSETSSHYL